MFVLEREKTNPAYGEHFALSYVSDSKVPILYHKSKSIQLVFVYTMSPSIYHEFKSMGRYTNICKIGQAGTTKMAFLNDTLFPKMMCFVYLYRLLIYLSNMVKLPNYCKLCFYQISIFHIPCLTADHVGTSVLSKI